MLANKWPRKARDLIRCQREGRMRRDARLVRAVRVAGMAGPAVLPRGRHDTRANEIEFDGSITGKGVAFAIHQGRFESSLPQRAGTPIAGVEAADIPARNGLHHYGLHHHGCMICERPPGSRGSSADAYDWPSLHRRTKRSPIEAQLCPVPAGSEDRRRRLQHMLDHRCRVGRHVVVIALADAVTELSIVWSRIQIYLV